MLERLRAGREGETEDETVGWHHRLDGHEFEQALGVGDGQGSLVCYSPWGCKESDRTEQLNSIVPHPTITFMITFGNIKFLTAH